MNCDITQTNIQELLLMISKNLYKASHSKKGSTDHDVIETCSHLLKLDYTISEVSNRFGDITNNYPSKIFIPETELRKGFHFNGLSAASTSQRGAAQETIYEQSFDIVKFRDLVNKARFARCRSRFPVPVILFRGKYVCRSATLSGGPEIYGRSGLDYLFYGSNGDTEEAVEVQEDDSTDDESKGPYNEWQLFNRVRRKDIRLIKYLNVGTIIDFMLENKKVKYGVNITSSEKIDKEKRYAEFTIVALPYPGCEFFREYRNNHYSAENIKFDWKQSFVDVTINVPDDVITSQLHIPWSEYKTWDLVTMTQNYLKLILKYLQDSSSGMLIHCISGWDRTPLFISLLRISLWADGAIHQTLNATQIVYLTISYDWYLFGHNLPDRLFKGEEILYFCFYALKYIEDDEFSVLMHRQRSKNSSSGSSSIGVLRTDSECMLDSILFEGDSKGSNLSINSFGSSVSGKSHQDHSHDGCEFTNGNAQFLLNNLDSNNLTSGMSESGNANSSWSPVMKRTSPVSVPMSSKTRHKTESVSSLSVGSWQMISGTGSLRSPEPNFAQQNAKYSSKNANHVISQESSSCTMVDDDCFMSTNSNEPIATRRKKLDKVREIFFNAYWTTIGSKTSSDLGAFFGSIAEKVGLVPKTL